jgi:hypothetical protein
MANEVKKAIDNAVDATKEALHRSKADAEHEKRAIYGDVMTPGEHAESMGREASENIKAGVDKTKRKVRSAT